jgi:hypothetical protein
VKQTGVRSYTCLAVKNLKLIRPFPCNLSRFFLHYTHLNFNPYLPDSHFHSQAIETLTGLTIESFQSHSGIPGDSIGLISGRTVLPPGLSGRDWRESKGSWRPGSSKEIALEPGPPSFTNTSIHIFVNVSSQCIVFCILVFH